MALLIRTHISLATTSLRQNRVRSFLTCLGIAIGIASIILILSLSGSIQRLITDQVKSVGADLIVVRPSSNKDLVSGIVDELTTSNQYQKSSLTLADVETIQNITTVASVAPIALSEHTVEGIETITLPVVATTPDLATILDLPIKSGQFITPELRENTSVIGYITSLELFGTTESVGQTITILDQKIMVVGVLSKLGDPINFNNVDLDRSVILSADYMKKIDDSIQIQQINVKVTTTDAVGATVSRIHDKLSSTKSGSQSFSVTSGDEISHPAGSLFSIISAMLTLVASISLVVGGIGVMNIMLVSVSERTREIGIRKAVGANNTNILLQFLFESLTLSLLGGFLGLILGYVLSFFLNIITPFAPYISLEILAITLGVSITVGVIFGLYPALKASRKNPIESLKYYR